MARTTPRPTPTATRTLQPLGRHCPLCGETMWAAYPPYRTSTTLDDVVHVTLQLRRCLNRACPQLRHPYRPAAEGRLALPTHEVGLDGIAGLAPCATPSTAACLQSSSPCAPGGWLSPHGRSRLSANALTNCSPSRSPTPRACSGSPRLRAGASWRWMVSHLTSALRCCGACGIASPGQASWPAVCCLRPHQPSPSCSGPCGKTCRYLLLAAGRTANCPAAVPSRRCAPMCHPMNGGSQAGVSLKPKSCGATVRPCAGPSRTLDGHRWRPRGSHATAASAR
jgi:hypothetical protein